MFIEHKGGRAGFCMATSPNYLLIKENLQFIMAGALAAANYPGAPRSTLFDYDHQIQGGAPSMSFKEKKDSKFSPRQIKFLELYFSGASMKTAARVAGYRGSSDQALCNQGRAIINKYEQSPAAKEIFRRAGASEIQIAQLLVDAVHNQSELKRMNSLKILCNCLFSKR